MQRKLRKRRSVIAENVKILSLILFKKNLEVSLRITSENFIKFLKENLETFVGNATVKKNNRREDLQNEKRQTLRMR